MKFESQDPVKSIIGSWCTIFSLTLYKYRQVKVTDHTKPRQSGNSCSRLCDDTAVAGLDWGASVTWLMVIGVRQYIPEADPLMRIEAYRELVHGAGDECQSGVGGLKP